MKTCERCVNMRLCHDKSLSDLKDIREIDSYLKIRDIVRAEDAVTAFWKKLRDRHNQLTGR